MLAQSFKTATDLGISQEAVDALHKVLVLLETEKIKHISEDDLYRRRIASKEILFNMSTWHIARNCGTVACIGGTATLISGIDFNRLVHEAAPLEMEPKIRNLYELFYPDVDGGYDALTTQQAAQALRNYLTTGKSEWVKVVGQETL